MVRRTDPKDDNWQSVKDAKKRKQIQDRLAQRARRERLRQAKLDTDSRRQIISTTRTRTSTSPQSDSSLENNQLLIKYSGAASLSSTSSKDNVDRAFETWESGSTPEDLLDFDPRTSDVDMIDPMIFKESLFAPISPISQPSFPFTVFSALFVNGEILGIPCSTTHVSRTPAPNPSIPLPLHATEIQRLVLHPRWFDRLPFPKMRDTLITLQGSLDEEELVKDIFTMPSWTIVPGKASWDPKAWKMEKEWSAKWGWLMF